MTLDDTEKPQDLRIIEFYDDITKACASEYKTICKVFPNPGVVMSQLMRRVFEQRV